MYTLISCCLETHNGHRQVNTVVGEVAPTTPAEPPLPADGAPEAEGDGEARSLSNLSDSDELKADRVDKRWVYMIIYGLILRFMNGRFFFFCSC